MQTKLTLRLEEKLILRAKDYAKKSGKSVSQIVADYFAVLEKCQEEPSAELTPIVRSLKGVLKDVKVDEQDYRRHLLEKNL